MLPYTWLLTLVLIELHVPVFIQTPEQLLTFANSIELMDDKYEEIKVITRTRRDQINLGTNIPRLLIPTEPLSTAAVTEKHLKAATDKNFGPCEWAIEW